MALTGFPLGGGFSANTIRVRGSVAWTAVDVGGTASQAIAGEIPAGQPQPLSAFPFNGGYSANTVRARDGALWVAVDVGGTAVLPPSAPQGDPQPLTGFPFHGGYSANSIRWDRPSVNPGTGRLWVAIDVGGTASVVVSSVASPPVPPELAPLPEVTRSVRVLSRDDSLAITGELVDGTLDVILRWQGVSTWTISCAADSTFARTLRASDGAGIQVRIDGHLVMSGTVERRGLSRSGGVSAVTASGVDDTEILRSAWVDPAPASPITSDTFADDYDTRTGPAGELMAAYVEANVGSLARTGRQRVTTVVPATGVGATITEAGRFGSLSDLLQRLADRSGLDLGWQVWQPPGGTDLRFDVWQPEDRSASVKFSESLGNLAGYEYVEERPAATSALIAGSGEGQARTVRIVGSGGREVFLDARDTADTAVLDDRATAELARRSRSVSLAADVIDGAPFAWCADRACSTSGHYRLGDFVGVTVDGLDLVGQVREVRLRWDPSGLTVTPVIGSGDPAQPSTFIRLADLEREVRGLASRF